MEKNICKTCGRLKLHCEEKDISITNGGDYRITFVKPIHICRSKKW